MQNPKLKKESFKEEFKKRIKQFILNLIQFIDSLPNERTSRIIGDQLMSSRTSIGANYFEARAASSKKILLTFQLFSEIS